MNDNNIKDKIIGGIIAREKGYVNNPKDRGGETKYGITKEVAHAHGYLGIMRKLPYSKAYKIYSRSYWDINNLDDIVLLSPKIAEEVADTGVNMGVQTAGAFLQRCLNALNKEEKFYDDVIVDGMIGLKTIFSLKSFLKYRREHGEEVLLKMLNSLQVARYIEICERDESQEVFLYGWVLNRG